MIATRPRHDRRRRRHAGCCGPQHSARTRSSVPTTCWVVPLATRDQDLTAGADSELGVSGRNTQAGTGPWRRGRPGRSHIEMSRNSSVFRSECGCKKPPPALPTLNTGSSINQPELPMQQRQLLIDLTLFALLALWPYLRSWKTWLVLLAGSVLLAWIWAPLGTFWQG